MKLLRKAVIIVGILSASVSTMAEIVPQVNVNACQILLKQAPFTENNRTYIPLRAVSENLGATVSWDQSKQQITIIKEDQTVVCYIDRKIATLNKEQVVLDAVPQIRQGTTYVPLRFTAQCLGADVNYDKTCNTINITCERAETIDLYNRKIRTTNLPKNAKDFPYILEGVPNEMYELKATYEYKNNVIEGYNVTRPVNIETETTYYNKENLKLWTRIIEENLRLKFNVDYRTINDEWAECMTRTYMACSSDNNYYRETLQMAREYINYIKENKIVIEGNYYIEPSICYVSSGQFYLRCWVKYRGYSAKSDTIQLFECYSGENEQNVWYEGYVDIGLGTNYEGSDGSDFGILSDTISRTDGIHKIK